MKLRHERDDVGRQAGRQFRHKFIVPSAGLGDKLADGDGKLVPSGELVGENLFVRPCILPLSYGYLTRFRAS